MAEEVRAALIQQVVDIACVSKGWARFALDSCSPPWDLSAAITLVVSSDFATRGAPPPPISTGAAGTSRAPLSPGGASEPSPTVSLNLGLQLASGQGIF